MTTNKDIAREIAWYFVKQIDPVSTDIVKNDFDVFYDNEITGKADRKQFTIDGETVTLGFAIIVFIASIFRDAAKDALKGLLMQLLKKWANKNTLSEKEISEIVSAFEAEGQRLGIPQKERAKAATEAKALLRKNPNVLLKQK